jgi:hypothetical protein
MINFLPKKTYESDCQADSGTNVNLLESDTGSGSQESGNEEIKEGFASKCCFCFKSQQKKELEKELRSLEKPTGLFGLKNYKEVCLELAQKSNYGNLVNKEKYGLISAIIKSGDDLK